MVVRPFKPTAEPRNYNSTSRNRANHIVERILKLDAATVATLLADVMEDFRGRHRNLLQVCEARADEMREVFAAHSPFTQDQRRLVGAYFVHEYSFEAAALFNPSIVSAPDQSGAPPDGRRFILSVRAVGEGHVSSLNFRSGVVAADGNVSVDPPSRLAGIPKLRTPLTLNADRAEVFFTGEEDISERVIFPVLPSQSNGIEDARFVEFEEAGVKTYYTTYTAYTGRAIRSELLETRDFVTFRMSSLSGGATHNKGMALFPRRIAGKYAMIARQDNENLHLIYSNDLYSWTGGEVILGPEFPWEFVQIGNCGSPIELDEGWLLLTHGVGPVRSYSIGAALLDKADPTKVLARSRDPIVCAEAPEREGYVPNVVYTCGAMRFRDRIILPYAISDSYCTFASMKIPELLGSLQTS